MRFYLPLLSSSIAALAFPQVAFAGTDPLYEPAPAWVEPVDLSTLETDSTKHVVVSDTQIRIEEGEHWQYVDKVVRIFGAEQLTKSGTVKAVWYPDKGDLIVHDISILRGGEVIDIVAGGERFEVIRREQRLEQAVVDGSLTATLFVPGLQIGDELRVTYSTTLSDQALGEEVQSQSYLWREPKNNADFARVQVSWPEGLEVSYKAWPQVDPVPIETRGGYDWINVTLPLPEAKEMPDDAPARFRQPSLLQVGTFADWGEVSSTMAPYYETTGALDGLDDLIARTDAIRAKYESELERAVAALDLVQKDVRYLLNGLAGGNYIPQDVSTTWDKKYGDCKAKTLILLALLDHLGIEAEAVLVDVNAGDAVQASLPIPGAFDHVLVRATIDGQFYYLDGTTTGADILLAGNVPGFQFALPIRESGAGIEPIVQVLPRVAETDMTMTVDASAGVDLPVLATFDIEFRGRDAALINAAADQLTDELKREFARRFSSKMEVVDVDLIKGESDSVARMVFQGIMPAVFEFDGGRGEFGDEDSFADVEFTPNRSRRDWREVPVSIGNPEASEFSIETILPGNLSEYELIGANQIEGTVAGRSITREVSLAGNSFNVLAKIANQGGEIAPEAVRTERRKAQSFARNEIKLLAPEDAPRLWRFALSKDRSELAALEQAYAKVIANDPKEADVYLSRAAFRFDTYDFAGSLADMDKVIEIEGAATYYSQRSTVYMQLLDYDAAKADLEEAYALDPTPGRAIDLAAVLLDMGDAAAAREAIEFEDGDEEVRQSLAYWMAHVDGLDGRPEEGLARYDEFLADDPNNASLLNNKCWQMGVWQAELDNILAVCTRAVEIGGSASAMDSRAMAYYRLGRLDEALGDINEALELDPDQAGSLLLRGFILLEMGNEEGRGDIAQALARSPDVAATYRKWGFDL